MTEVDVKKLAERAGLKFFPDCECIRVKGICWGEDERTYGVDGKHHFVLPRFTDSTDACFEWLINPREDILRVEFSYRTRYPELEVGCKITMRSWHPDRTKGRVAFSGVAPKDKPALALCKALEQLVEKE